MNPKTIDGRKGGTQATKHCARHAHWFPSESTNVSVDQFHAYALSDDGLQPQCKRCRKEDNKVSGPARPTGENGEGVQHLVTKALVGRKRKPSDTIESIAKELGKSVEWVKAERKRLQAQFEAQPGNAGGKKKRKKSVRGPKSKGRLANGLLPPSRWSNGRKGSGETNGKIKGHRRSSGFVLRHDPLLDTIIKLLKGVAS